MDPIIHNVDGKKGKADDRSLPSDALATNAEATFSSDTNCVQEIAGKAIY
jgi:hypothetical protein